LYLQYNLVAKIYLTKYSDPYIPARSRVTPQSSFVNTRSQYDPKPVATTTTKPRQDPQQDATRLVDLQCALDEKEVLILQLKEKLEAEQARRSKYAEGKDECIFKL
jgi:hypothetical protein